MKTLTKHIIEALNIPKNNYKKPTETREEVVQAICDAFLKGRKFSPRLDYGHRYIQLNKLQFLSSYEKDSDSVRFNGAEMNAAFKALIDAGYYMMVKKYRRKDTTYLEYACSEKPHMEYYQEVEEFTYPID